MTTKTKTRDYSKYLSEAYIEEVQVQPYVQFLHSAKKVGFFIPEQFKDDLGFKPELGGVEKHTVITKSGDEIPGWRIPNPRLIVVRETGLYMTREGTNEILSFNKELKNQVEKEEKRKVFTPFKKYLLFFLNAENELLHSIPVKWTARGTAGTTFAQQLSTFRKEMDNIFNEFTGESRKQGTKRLHALKIAEIYLKPEEIRLENGSKIWVTTVSGIASPSKETFSDYFVPDISSDLKEIVIDAFENSESFEQVKKTLKPGEEDINDIF